MTGYMILGPYGTDFSGLSGPLEDGDLPGVAIGNAKEGGSDEDVSPLTVVGGALSGWGYLNLCNHPESVPEAAAAWASTSTYDLFAFALPDYVAMYDDLLAAYGETELRRLCMPQVLRMESLAVDHTATTWDPLVLLNGTDDTIAVDITFLGPTYQIESYGSQFPTASVPITYPASITTSYSFDGPIAGVGLSVETAPYLPGGATAQVHQNDYKSGGFVRVESMTWSYRLLTPDVASINAARDAVRRRFV